MIEKIPETEKMRSEELQSEKPKLPESGRSVEHQPHGTEYLDSVDFLKSFPNNIAPSAVLGVEKRSDGATIIHCNDLYEYLKFGFREDLQEMEKIEKYKEIFQSFSLPENVSLAMRLKDELSEEEQKWIMEKLTAAGSAVPVEFADGRKESIVMMNDMLTRRMFNHDGTLRNEDQLRAYDNEYSKIVEHEVRHTKYYRKFGKDLEAWRKTMESIRPLSHTEQKKYHYDRYTKDEIVAHMENDIEGSIEDGQGDTDENWNHIIDNLQQDTYRFDTVFDSGDKAEYLSVVTSLVEIAKETYRKTKSVDAVMDTVAGVDVTKLL